MTSKTSKDDWSSCKKRNSSLEGGGPNGTDSLSNEPLHLIGNVISFVKIASLENRNGPKRISCDSLTSSESSIGTGRQVVDKQNESFHGYGMAGSRLFEMLQNKEKILDFGRKCDASTSSTKRRKMDSKASKIIIIKSEAQGLNMNALGAMCSPTDFYVDTLREFGCITELKSALQVHGYFVEKSVEQIEAYDMETVCAVRTRNVKKLSILHAEGTKVNCCNHFGESVLHMACRRGYIDVVKFLLDTAGGSLRVRDDYGRTPLHDAFWTVEPNFTLIDFIVKEEPDLMLMKDKRGHIPLQYCRQEHWDVINEHLGKIKNDLLPKTFMKTKELEENRLVG